VNTQTQATNACQTLGGTGCASQNNSCCGFLCLSGSVQGICGSVSGTTYCWNYGGSNKGKVTTGSSPACSGGNSWN
jgi:hypothetical protein